MIWARNAPAGVLLVAIGVIVGGFAQNALMAIDLDEEFWREFTTGPPIAGLFAVGGAAIAYAAAAAGARITRRGAERQEWWDRAEWALNLARSDVRADRLIGLRALEGLQDQATESEFAMIVAVTEAVAGDEADVDTEGTRADNRRKWWRWV